MENSDKTSDNELSVAWREEIRRRCREIDEGAVKPRDADGVFTKAYAAIL